MDRAIGASSATQLIRFITGPITMLLIIRYLTPEEQGFFYSFAGVMGIQVFLEAGFSQSIIQFSSKEFSRLRFNRQGLLVGNRESLSRLRSIFHKANHYYTLMAAVLALALVGGGYWFFSLKDSHGVPWMIPWFVASASAGLGFLLTPFWAVLEGCNRVAQIAVYRFWLTLSGFAVSATCLALDQGIYTVVWGSIFMVVYPVIYLVYRWRGLIAQIMRPAGRHQVSWGGEIWGFQWRIAGTWMSRYFLESGVVPLVFHVSGAVVAGQTGLTFQLLKTIASVASMWTVTKIPAWGGMAARGEWSAVVASWRPAATRHVLINLIGLAGIWLLLAALSKYLPVVGDRFLPVLLMSGYALGWFLYSIWLSCSHFTRALCMEPFVFLHVVVGILFLAITFGAPANHSETIPWAFAFVHFPAAVVACFILARHLAKLRRVKSATTD